MGTNYFWYEKSPCPHCGRPYEPLHIGKSSAGWCFSLHVYPELGINTLNDWRKKLFSKGCIKNEYDELISYEVMMAIITDRRSGRGPISNEELDQILKDNHAVAGPNNLLRHRVDGRFCIGHGDGTFDYIIGEFS